jgi:hypothetical protein
MWPPRQDFGNYLWNGDGTLSLHARSNRNAQLLYIYIYKFEL